MEWQPIETAPKDGTFIMAWRDAAKFGLRERLVFVAWLDGHWCWPDDTVDIFDNPSEILEEMGDRGDFFHSNDFTHWMPLPQPPRT